jgi:hypothetical protein
MHPSNIGLVITLVRACTTASTITAITAASVSTRPTTNDVHYGRAQERHDDRDLVLAAAHAARPERFVRGVPHAPPLPTAVWINKPAAD